MKRSLLVHEQRIIGRVMKEHDLKVSLDHHSPGRGSGRGRCRERVRKRATRVESYNFHELGHFQYQCPQEDTKANFTEAKEEMLLIASEDVKEE
jgi:hypothetical protein